MAKTKGRPSGRPRSEGTPTMLRLTDQDRARARSLFPKPVPLSSALVVLVREGLDQMERFAQQAQTKHRGTV